MKDLTTIIPKYAKLAMRSDFNIASVFARQINEDDWNQLYEIPEPYEIDEDTFVIPINGALSYNVLELEKAVWLGSVSDYADIQRWTREQLNSKYKNIVYYINSPGGTITQMYETANVIEKLGKVKNTVVYTDSMCCSAAQVLAAACNHIVASPSADLASINVVSMRYDISEMLKNAGIKVEVFTGGELKTTYWDSIPLSDTQREYLNANAMELADEIKTYMRSKIENIEEEDMRGQTISGKEMYKKGYISNLSDTFDDFLQLL